MGDAAMPLDMSSFDHKQSGAGIRQHAEMREVPVIGDAIIGAVLAHRRNDDAVRQGQVGKFDRREQGARHRSVTCGWR